jgi:AbrB family looped-hinge helix DNA binding protein
MSATVVLGKQGRLVIPVDVRTALGLQEGDRLHLRVADGALVVERPDVAVARLKGLGKNVPSGRSLVGELLAERRRAAGRSE